MECKLITKHTWINFWKEEAGNAQMSCSSLVSFTEKEVPEVVQVSLLWLAAAKEEHHRRQKLAAASDSAAAEGPSEGVPRAVASCAAVSPSSSTLGNSEEQTGTEGVLPS